LTIDKDLNTQTKGQAAQISTADSRLQAWVIPTDEELLIARDTVRCILGEPHPT
jgi:acetate kinase